MKTDSLIAKVEYDEDSRLYRASVDGSDAKGEGKTLPEVEESLYRKLGRAIRITLAILC